MVRSRPLPPPRCWDDACAPAPPIRIPSIFLCPFWVAPIKVNPGGAGVGAAEFAPAGRPKRKTPDAADPVSPTPPRPHKVRRRGPGPRADLEVREVEEGGCDKGRKQVRFILFLCLFLFLFLEKKMLFCPCFFPLGSFRFFAG